MKLTQIDLLESEICSSVVCELCLRSLQLANALRIQLLENEQKLYEFLEGDEELEEPTSSIQYFEPQIKMYSASLNTFHENSSTSQTILNQRQTNSEKSEKDHKEMEIESDVQIKTESSEEKIMHDEQVNKTPEPNPFGIVRERYPSITQFISYSMKSNANSHPSNHIQDQNESSTSENESKRPREGGLREKRFKPTPSTPSTSRMSEKVIHKNPISNNYECSHCSFATSVQNAMKNHLIESHQAEIQSYKCPHCDSTYFKGSNLKRHIMVKHMNHRLDCIVDGCNSQFQDRSSLRRHLIRKHGREMPPEEVQNLVLKTRKETIKWF